MLDNTNSDFAGFSARNSIIDAGQNGDTNNNFNLDCTMEEGSQREDEVNGFSDNLNFSRLRRFVRKKIASTKFKNIQIEMLYQRYLLRMNQNNAAHIVWLLFALIFILGIIHINFLLNRWNDELRCGNATEAIVNQTALISDVNYTIFENEINSTATLELLKSLNSSQSELDTCIDPVNTYELLGTNFIQFSLLGLCCILYTILLLCLYKQRINEIYLFHVSYAIIISLVIIDISFSITNMGKYVVVLQSGAAD